MRESLTSPNDRLRTVAYSFFEHHPDPRDDSRLLSALDKEQARIRAPGADARACRAGRRPARAAGAAARRSCARRGFFPQRGHRGARRLQGAVRVRRASPRSPSSTVRCRTMPPWRSGRSATNERSRRWRRCRSTAPRSAADDRRRDVSARHQLRSHESVSDRDAEVRRRPNPGFRRCCEAARTPWRPGGGAARRARSTRCSRPAFPSQRSGARAGLAGARHRRPAQPAADSEGDRELRDRERAIDLVRTRSTCWTKISREEPSSSPCARPFGPRPRARRAPAAQALIESWSSE